MLVDNALSPRLAQELVKFGYDAMHVRELGMADAKDAEILERARIDRRILVSRDGDFAALLALARSEGPSFVHMRVPAMNLPAAQCALLLSVFEQSAEDLRAGAIVTVRADRIRIRPLPIVER